MSVQSGHTGTGRLRAAFCLLFFAVCSIFLAYSGWRLVRTIVEWIDRSSRYDAIIVKAAMRNGLEPCLVKAVIWRESKFDRTKRGGKGEIGLMQILPKFAVRDWARITKRPMPGNGVLADPELNIEIGCWYLARAKKYWSEYKEAEVLALCEYNAGRTRARAWKPDTKDGTVTDRINIASTKVYVTEIEKRKRHYEKKWDWRRLLK